MFFIEKRGALVLLTLAAGGMLRMMGFDREGKLVKTCTVTSGMKLKSGATVLKSMEILRHQPGSKKVISETTLELRKP